MQKLKTLTPKTLRRRSFASTDSREVIRDDGQMFTVWRSEHGTYKVWAENVPGRRSSTLHTYSLEGVRRHINQLWR